MVDKKDKEKIICNTLVKTCSLYLSLFQKTTRLLFLYGMIRATPAKEIKKMKLRQIKKDLEALEKKRKEVG